MDLQQKCCNKTAFKTKFKFSKTTTNACFYANPLAYTPDIILHKYAKAEIVSLTSGTNKLYNHYKFYMVKNALECCYPM